MKQLFLIILVLVSTLGEAQSAGSWTMIETTGGTSKVIKYQVIREGDGGVLTCERPQGALVTVFDSRGQSVKWTRQNHGGSLELSRVGTDLVVRGSEGSRFPAGDLPWIQDLNLLAPFVVGPQTKVRFTAFADFLDTRLQASDMTTFVATKVKREVQRWGTGEGQTWKVRVTFDDFRAAFWGAWYWFRVSDGRLVRTEEVRGAPGTPVTVAVLTEES